MRTTTPGAWRQRMGIPKAEAIYKERAANRQTFESQGRIRGLQEMPVCGLAKVWVIAL